jgi:hypothetical protein
MGGSTPASVAYTTRSRPCRGRGGFETRPYLVNHRCHLYQGTDTSTIAAGHAMLTAGRPSFVESLYSSSIATLMIISPVSAVSGPETARNPSMREPSSDSNSTRCPGSGTRGGLFLPNVISSPIVSV